MSVGGDGHVGNRFVLRLTRMNEFSLIAVNHKSDGIGG